MAGLRLTLFLGGCVLFLFVAVVAVVGTAVLLLLTRRAGFSPAANQAIPIIERWARSHGYEVLKNEPYLGRDHPFADRFGFGLGKMPAVVHRQGTDAERRPSRRVGLH